MIVTDVEIPRIDGYVLTAKLKSDRRFDGIPVMMHSSLSTAENVRMGAGADAYMPKLAVSACVCQSDTGVRRKAQCGLGGRRVTYVSSEFKHH